MGLRWFSSGDIKSIKTQWFCIFCVALKYFLSGVNWAWNFWSDLCKFILKDIAYLKIFLLLWNISLRGFLSMMLNQKGNLAKSPQQKCFQKLLHIWRYFVLVWNISLRGFFSVWILTASKHVARYVLPAFKGPLNLNKEWQKN